MAGDTAETETGIAVPVPDENGDTPSKSADNSHDASGLSPRDDTILEDDEQDPDTTPPAGGGLSEDAIALKQELAKITVEPPTKIIDPSEIFNPADFPESYKENLPKEKLVLAFSENFRRQFVHLYRDRKPLLLNPVNECGVEKLVCTTIRPTQLSFRELYDWDGAGEFVADYLNFTTLDPAHELPTRLLSPTTVLKRQKGNCFEYSTLLASLLIAAGYDAYVVSGYANRETCLMDETREICPMLRKKQEAAKEEEKREQKKYTVKPPKDLRSKFELKMAARAEKEEVDAEEKRKQEEQNKQADLEKPPPDPLHGLRVHSWVLVLEGKREVPQSFFIEPLTGVSHPLTSGNYLGIESVWNHHNYWVNMQDCSQGVATMKYDLGDCAIWEYMFPSNDKPLLQLPDEDDYGDDLDDDEDQEIEKHLDLPPSWVDPIDISNRDFQMRCPYGKKVKLYKRAKLEKFAHYLLKDGLVSKLSAYQDRELQDMIYTKEYFEHRHDKLYERMHNHRTGWVYEYMYNGRHMHLKEHHYKASAPGPENERTMQFYNEARVDGLGQRVETPSSMEEHYKDRSDFLFYRYVEFGKRPKKFGPADANANARPILKMIEKYYHNPDVDSNDDVAELIFNNAEEKIQITYHTEGGKISSSTREYVKPPNLDEKGATIQWHQENHTTFQVDPDREDKKKVELYQILVELISREDKCREKVRESEDEVMKILSQRTQEEIASELDISVYDTERNDKARKQRQDMERLQEEEKKRREDMEIDYLAPFLAQIGDPEKISRQQAFKLKEDCLADLKQRLIDKANLIQSRFEKETQELQKKQAWYQQNQVSMQKDDEEEYLNYCGEAMFRINILELRLNRHKERAPQKYMELEQKIRSDPRLTDYF